MSRHVIRGSYYYVVGWDPKAQSYYFDMYEVVDLEHVVGTRGHKHAELPTVDALEKALYRYTGSTHNPSISDSLRKALQLASSEEGYALPDEPLARYINFVVVEQEA